jgi:hypothetical protein
VAERQDGTLVLSEQEVESLRGVIERLLKSEFYRARLRRVLVNGWDPKVLTDFLVLDDLFLVVRQYPFVNPEVITLFEMRSEVFTKAVEGAERRLDVRVYSEMWRLERYLRDLRSTGETATQVFAVIYGHG